MIVRRAIILLLTIVLVTLMLANTENRSAAIVAMLQLIVPLTFLGGCLGMINTVRYIRLDGLNVRNASLGILSLMVLGWAFEALRIAAKRTAEIHGYQEAGTLDFSVITAYLALFLVFCGVFVWRWAMHWPVADRLGHLGEMLWPVPLLIWTAVVVFDGSWIEDLLVRIYQVMG